MMKKRKERRIYNLFFLLILAWSCTNKPVPTEINLKLFSLSFDSIDELPIVVEDSSGYNGYIFFDSWKDTIHFKFGYGDVNNLAEVDPIVVYHPYNIDTLISGIDAEYMDTSKIIFTNKMNYDIDEFRKQNVFFSDISGFRSKIIIPREIIKGGITGVYFDSLRLNNYGRLKFNFYATNLDKEENDQLLGAIKSITFHLDR